jgi:hypothetical protein
LLPSTPCPTPTAGLYIEGYPLVLLDNYQKLICKPAKTISRKGSKYLSNGKYCLFKKTVTRVVGMGRMY